MEILYVTTMAAIFVLCLALLFTARRILRSSPLSGGELGLSRMYEVQMPGESAANPETEMMSSFEDSVRGPLDSVTDSAFGTERVETEAVMASWVASPVQTTLRTAEPVVAGKDETESFLCSTITLEASAAESSLSEPVKTGSVGANEASEQHVLASSIHRSVSGSKERTVADKAAAPPLQKKAARRRKALPGGYNYALECLLLGVSVVVLVTTQRSTLRHRPLKSHHRVA